MTSQPGNKQLQYTYCPISIKKENYKTNTSQRTVGFKESGNFLKNPLGSSVPPRNTGFFIIDFEIFTIPTFRMYLNFL